MLDGASAVAVRLDDICNIRIQVVDDGRGMTKNDLLVAGRRLWSSRRERGAGPGQHEEGACPGGQGGQHYHQDRRREDIED